MVVMDPPKPSAPRFPTQNVDIHFIDDTHLQIDDCRPFDEGWAIQFSSGDKSWVIPKSRIKMIERKVRWND